MPTPKDIEAARTKAAQVNAAQVVDAEMDAAIQASLADQEERIRGEVPPNETQISPLQELKHAMNYKADPLVESFHQLQETYPGMRGVRGDGNCYYRSVMYGLIEQMIASPYRAKLFEQLEGRTKALLDYDKGQYDQDIQALVLILYEAQHAQRWLTLQALEQDMRDPNSTTDALLIRGARVFIARDAEKTISAGFLAERDLESMLTMGKDVEGAPVENAVLLKALGISGSLVRIQTNQGPRQGERSIRTKSPGENKLDPAIAVHILLRPGHYDLLYSNEQWTHIKRFQQQHAVAAKAGAASVAEDKHHVQISPAKAAALAPQAAYPAVAAKAGAGAGAGAQGLFNNNASGAKSNPVDVDIDIDWNFYLKCLSSLAMVAGGAMLVVGLLLPVTGLTIAGACLLGAGVVGLASSYQDPEDEGTAASFN